MNQIFLSYRREDSADVSGRINDRLAEHFGQDAIFTDVDSIPLGIDFQQYIDKQVGKCNIFLAVIGRDWLSVTDTDGSLRLQQSGDFVRIEVESALQRNIPVIPLLVRRATMPSGDDLPDTLNGLATKNGIQIRPNPDFNRDMERLINGIEQHLSRQSEAATKRKADEQTVKEREERQNLEAEAKRKAEESKKAKTEAKAKREAKEGKKESVIESEQTKANNNSFLSLVFSGGLIGSVIGAFLAWINSGSIDFDRILGWAIIFGLGGAGLGAYGWAMKAGERVKKNRKI